jgi:hypothetical protein
MIRNFWTKFECGHSAGMGHMGHVPSIEKIISHRNLLGVLVEMEEVFISDPVAE